MYNTIFIVPVATPLRPFPQTHDTVLCEHLHGNSVTLAVVRPLPPFTLECCCIIHQDPSMVASKDLSFDQKKGKFTEGAVSTTPDRLDKIRKV